MPELQRLVMPGASLGGARPKSLIHIDGDPWLVKFSEGEDFDVPLVVHAAMDLARLCGVDVAATRALPVVVGHAVAVRRFDRVGPARLHAVSAHVALHAAGEEFGYPQLSQLLRRVAPAADIHGQQARLFGLKPDAARAVVSEVAAKVAGWKEEFTAKGVAAADIELLAQYLDGDKLRHQRDAFLPG